MRYACLLLLAVGCATPEEAAQWVDVGSPVDGAPDRAPDAAPDREPPPADAGAPADAAPLDLDAGPDAAPLDLDAAPPEPDAAPPEPDAGPPDPDASAGWGPCAVDGVPGECLPVEDCAGTATPGFCPGPAEIQCCTDAPPPEPDPEPEPEDWGPCEVRGVPGECLPVEECEGFTTPGFCPGPAGIRCCTAEAPPEPEGFECDPALHPQPNAGSSEPAGLDGCPDGMLGIDGFCVDRYEAALVEVMPDGGEAPWSPYHNPGGVEVRAVSLAGAVPQGYITGIQAAAACEAAGKRLCTDAEWLRACQWTDGRTFPYGAERVGGLCNDSRDQHPAVELFPDDPDPFARIQDACINQLPDGLARTGAHPECVTPEGLYDMMGNLHEWTADPEGTFRGGFYVDTVRNGPGCLYRTTAHDRGHWDYSTGFRCCADR